MTIATRGQPVSYSDENWVAPKTLVYHRLHILHASHTNASGAAEVRGVAAFIKGCGYSRIKGT